MYGSVNDEVSRSGRRSLVCGLGLWLAVVFLTGFAAASSCRNLTLTAVPPDYFIYPEYRGVCPDESGSIRCYRYHWDWVCEKGDVLFWDRRLEAAAHAACGCTPPPGVSPASPSTSGKPREGIFGTP